MDSGPPDPAEVRRELAAILESASFRGSRRCQDFLGFVVRNALEGNHDSLKERTLAVEIFGRKANADLGDDSIVRVGAREVRKRLAQFYVTEGLHHPLRIHLPPGTYVPSFDHPAAEEAADPPVTAASVPMPAPRSRRTLWIAPIALAAALIAWRAWSSQPTAFDTFWQPVFASGAPINIAVAHPIVYHPSSRALELDTELNGAATGPGQRPIHVPSARLGGSDFVPVLDQYTGFGDTVAAARVFGLCARRDRPAHIRLASRLDFADLRDSATILVGGSFTNRWTLDLTQGFRFRMILDAGKPSIVDSTSGRQWVLTGKTEDGRSAEDFILIARLPHSQSGGAVIAGAGLTVNGTAEAGRILADPDTLIPVLGKLPRDWKDHNLQIVLHSRIVGDTPAAPELIDSHSW